MRELKHSIEQGEDDVALQRHVDEQSGHLYDLYTSLLKRTFGQGVHPEKTREYLALFNFTHEENQNSDAENCSTLTLLDISFVYTTLEFIEALSDDQSCESYKLQLSRSLKATISDLEKTSANLLEVYYPGTHKRCTKIRSSVFGVMQYSVRPIHRSVVEFAI